MKCFCTGSGREAVVLVSVETMGPADMPVSAGALPDCASLVWCGMGRVRAGRCAPGALLTLL